MMMFVSILSGVITHRRIFAEFFTFRAGKGQRSWLDAHNATGVLALLFHLMIGCSGLVSFMFMYQPLPRQAVYGNDQKTWLHAACPTTQFRAKPAAMPAALPSFGSLLDKASAPWGGLWPDRIEVRLPNDANALIGVVPAPAVADGAQARVNGQPLFAGIANCRRTVAMYSSSDVPRRASTSGRMSSVAT